MEKRFLGIENHWSMLPVSRETRAKICVCGREQGAGGENDDVSNQKARVCNPHIPSTSTEYIHGLSCVQVWIQL